MLILASSDVFQWDASDATFDLGGQNVLRTFEMAIRHYRRTTRTGLQRESERVFCRRIYFHLRSKILLWPYYGGDRPHAPPLSIRHSAQVSQCVVELDLSARQAASLTASE